MNEAESQCLRIAERIIGCLNGGEVLRKYLGIKKRIFQNEDKSPQISKHLKTIAMENRSLMQNLEKIKNESSNQITLNDWIIDQIQSFQKKLLPESETLDNITFETACSSLNQVVDAKIASNSIIRQKLTDDNSQIRNKISSLIAASKSDLKMYSLKRNESINLFHQYQEQLQTQIQKCNKKVEKYNQQIKVLKKDNENINKFINEKHQIAQSITQKKQKYERKKSISQERISMLRSNANSLSNQLHSKTHEIEIRKTSQRFGIENITDEEIAELNRLEEELTLLEDRNNFLSVELKMKKLIQNNTIEDSV